MKDKKLLFLSASAGLLAGAVNGFFGAGGGMILVPFLTALCKMEERRAFATSVAVMLPLSAVSAAVYLLRGGLPFLGALPYALGGALGGALAGRLLGRLPVRLLRRVFALFIIYGGVRSML